jgi:high-affinity iron transporter
VIGPTRFLLLVPLFAVVAAPVTSRVRNPASGTIVGVVSTAERASIPIRVSFDREVCGQTVPDDSLNVDPAGHVGGAVLTVAGVTAAAPSEAVVVNDSCRFAPHGSILRPRGVVRMSSSDAVMHTMHAASTQNRTLFNLSLPFPNVTLSRSVDRPGIVRLTCSTHPWMRGYLFVTGQLSSISASDGRFRLEGVPAGRYVLEVWHETLRSAPLPVTVSDGETVTVAVTLTR